MLGSLLVVVQIVVLVVVLVVLVFMNLPALLNTSSLFCLANIGSSNNDPGLLFVNFNRPKFFGEPITNFRSS